MNFDQYWASLIHRIHVSRETIVGDEDTFYRLSAIRGETMVDGIEAYFERRFAQFDADMNALTLSGFHDLAQEFLDLRGALFGDAPLTEGLVTSVIFGLYSPSEATTALQQRVDAFCDRVRPRLDDLEDFRDQLGLRAGLYESIE